MALFQFGPNITGLRNSIAGQTFSQNKGGTYAKAKPIPTNPRSPAQQAVRAAFALNSKQWSGTLTDSQRAAWNFFAANNPYNNVFGQSKQLSGMSMMMKLNQVLSQIGAAFEGDAPADLSVPGLAAVTGFGSEGGGSNIETITITTAAQAVTAGAKYYIFATPPLAAGKSAGTSDFRFIEATAAIAAAVTIEINTAYFNVFGSGAAEGNHISVLVATVNTATGALSVGLKFDAVVDFA